ncbi:MAG: hypothetical protein SNJ78_12025, partial [Spirochaetales bacterium]
MGKADSFPYTPALLLTLYLTDSPSFQRQIFLVYSRTMTFLLRIAELLLPLFVTLVAGYGLGKI